MTKPSARAAPLAKVTKERGRLAMPSRCQQRLPGLTAHDVAEIDAEMRAALNDPSAYNLLHPSTLDRE